MTEEVLFFKPIHCVTVKSPSREVWFKNQPIRVGLELSEEFEVKIGVHQGSVLSPLVFAMVVDVVTENVRNG